MNKTYAGDHGAFDVFSANVKYYILVGPLKETKAKVTILLILHPLKKLLPYIQYMNCIVYRTGMYLVQVF